MVVCGSEFSTSTASVWPASCMSRSVTTRVTLAAARFAGTGIRDPVTITSSRGGWASPGLEGDCADATAQQPKAKATPSVLMRAPFGSAAWRDGVH